MLPRRLASIDAINRYILLFKVVLNHLDLLEAGAKVFVLHVAREYHELEVTTQVAQAIDAADADPHAVLLLF